MNSKEIVKAIMEKQNVSNATLAGRLKIAPVTLWDRLYGKKAKDLSIPILIDILSVLDYKVVIVPKDKRIQAEEYAVTVQPKYNGADSETK